MMKQVLGKRVPMLSFFFAFVLLFSVASIALGEQPAKHVVQKGDTLWGICEKYYGDPNLWPKLWEMNPFVTNPHLLRPGDIITLLVEEQVKKAEPSKKAPPETDKPAPVLKGIDISDRIALDSLGYLSLTEVASLGAIESSTSKKILVSQGEKVFLNLGENKEIKPGDVFSVVHPSEMIRHPLTGKPLGYIVSVRGNITVKEYLQRGRYLAEMGKPYAEVYVGDLVVYPRTIASCLQPMPTDSRLYGNIVGTRGNLQVIGKGSVVYLDSGFKDGVKRGATFDVIRIYKLPLQDYWDTFSKEQYLSDFWNKIEEGQTLYEFSVGKLIVLDSMPDTAVAVILASTEEVALGSFVKGLPWTEPPDFIASLPSCVIK